MEPMMPDSIIKIILTKADSAPRHFIVPISRNLSETDMSIALLIPIMVTIKEIVIIHILRTFSLAMSLSALIISSGLISRQRSTTVPEEDGKSKFCFRLRASTFWRDFSVRFIQSMFGRGPEPIIRIALTSCPTSCSAVFSSTTS